MRETNERGRRHEIRKISIDVGHVALIAIRRRTLIIFYYRHSPRDNSMFTGQKKTTSCYFTSPYFVPTTHPFNPVHLFFPFDCFSSKRCSHLLPSRTHPPMHAHSSQKPSSKATGDTKRREGSRRGIERNWKHRRRNSPLVP